MNYAPETSANAWAACSTLARMRTAETTRSPAVLALAAGDAQAAVRILAAGNRHMSAVQLSRLAEDSYVPIAAAALANPACPADTLARAAKSTNQQIRRAAATNQSCPELILRVMAFDRHPMVRAAVRKNSAAAPDVRVAAAVADAAAVGNGGRPAPPEVLKRLVEALLTPGSQAP